MYSRRLREQDDYTAGVQEALIGIDLYNEFKG